ncbi:MAG: two-component regulator propeller domain-containing protein [Bacteroidota bacterium]
MKNCILFFSFCLIFISCNTNSKPNDIKTLVETSALAKPVVLTPGTDTLKPPVVTQLTTANAPKLIASGTPTITANPFADGLGQPGFTNFGTEQGLALSGINCGFMDKMGNLWFGTYGGGVSKYDGRSFTTYSTAQGLVNNTVWSIAEDKKGNLWFGTYGGGVSKYDGRCFTNYTTAQGLANNAVRSIIEDSKGNLWFGTYGGGISKYDGKTFTNYTTAQGLANNTVWSIVEDKRGNLWFGTNAEGVSKYDGKTFTTYRTIQSADNNTIFSIAEDKAGNLWFGSYGSGVSKYDGKNFTNYSTAHGLVNNVVLSIIEDASGNLWFGTNGGGVSKYDGVSFTNYSTTEGLANNAVWSITEDKAKNLWFGTLGGGISKYNGRSFTHYSVTQGLTHNTVWSIEEDKNGDLWFGTYGGGVSKYDGRSFTNYTTAQGLANDGILNITEDRTGNLWFGTNGSGVSKYDGRSFTNYSIAQGLAGNAVRTAAEDKAGNLWFGTDNAGVSKFDGKSFTNYSTAQGLANNAVLSMAADKKGNLWFGTQGGGVSKFDGKTFTNYTTAQGLANNTVLSITEDKTGNLWLGTEGGVSKYDGISFANYSTKDGLADNVVTQVVIDSHQNIVLATNLGFCVLEYTPLSASTKKQNSAAMFGTNSDIESQYKPVFQAYNNKTGYPVKDINAGQHCMFCDSKGILWAGCGDNKLVRIDMDAINTNLKPLSLVIQNIKISEENIAWYNLNEKLHGQNLKLDSNTVAPNITEEVTTFGRELNQSERDSMARKFGDMKFEDITKWYPLPEQLLLPYNHNSITFEFAAIDPGMSKFVKYQYMLQGYDDNWSPLTNNTSATFGNMSEGSYTFKLKCLSPYNVWSETGYTFKVLPPWYRTWWMYTVYVLVLISFIWILVWYNGRKLKAKAMELKQKVDEATHEIKEQKHIIEEKHKEITDSINYAERIQRSLLASKELLDANLSVSASGVEDAYFVFFQPKDIVSGDFYWAAKLDRSGEAGNFVLVTADSTGHGVPGAIMSILNISCLKETVKQGITQPAEILNNTRKLIIETLKKDGSAEGGKDGMDASLITFDLANNKMTYAAANNPVWIVRDHKLLEYKADKMPIGKHDKDDIPFTQHIIDLKKGDVVYSITDGMADQFGGPKGKKFMYKRLKELVTSIAALPMQEQKEKLSIALNDWKGNLAQVDDVCIIGVKI